MTNLTDKFTALEEQLAAAALIIQGYTDTIEPKLQSVLDLMDVMNVNNAANTRYLLSALNAIDPCANCPPPSVIVTPPTTNPTFPGSDSCKRSQAFVAFMSSAATVLDVVSGLGTGTFPSLVTSAIQEIIDANAAFSGVPIISFPEAVQLVGSLINYGILNIGRGDTLSGAFSSIASSAQTATFNATSAENAKAAYDAVVSGSGLPSDEKSVLVDAGYDGLFTFFFDPASTPDLTGFSGTACGSAEEVCDQNSSSFFNGSDSTYQQVWTGTAFDSLLVPGSGGIVLDQGAGTMHYTVVSGTLILGVSFVIGGGGVITYAPGDVIPADVGRQIFWRSQAGPATVNLCITPS